MKANNRPRGSSHNPDPLYDLLSKYLYDSERRWHDNDRRWQDTDRRWDEGHNRWEYQQKVTQHLILTLDQHIELNERRWTSQQELNRTINTSLGTINDKVDQILIILRGQPQRT